MAVSRTVKIAVAAVALVAVYFGLVFMSGALSERAAEQFKAQVRIEVANSRVLQVKDMVYQRGFFQSIATGTYTLVGTPRLTPDKGPITFQMRHVITHGPVTRSGLGWARTQSELFLDPASAAEVAKVIGDKKPLEIIARHGFLGGIRGSLTSPAFELEEEGKKFAWGGVQGKFSFGRDASALAGDFLLPALSFNESEGNLVLKNITFKLDLHRVFDVLYEGTMAAELGELQYVKADGEPFKVEKLAYALDLDRKGEFMNAKLRFGSGPVEMQGFKLKKAQYDLTVKHVHAPTYAAYTKDLQAMSEKLTAGSDPQEAEEMMSAQIASSMGDVFLKLLEKDPELVIDRIGITAEEGEFGITGSVKFVGFKPEDLQMGPAGAIRKLQADLKVFLDEPLLDIQLPESKANEADDVDPTMDNADQDPEEGDVAAPSTSFDRSKLHAQVAQMEQLGFLARNGKRVESRLEVKDGQITANGKRVAGGQM
jgi:uncharacterized protein YdgA (DUF945 family)